MAEIYKKLATELHKITKSISPKHISEIFKLRNNQRYNLRRILSFCALQSIRFSMVLKPWYILVQKFGT